MLCLAIAVRSAPSGLPILFHPGFRLLDQLQPLRGGKEQPAFEVLRLDFVVQHRGPDAAPQFVAVILQGDQQHPALAEYMSPVKARPVARESNCAIRSAVFADCPIAQHPGQKPPAKAVAEQPAARRDRPLVLPRIPFAERRLMLTVALFN